MSKTALVIQGGGLRGAFTSGVLDVFLENNVEFDLVIGASSGATCGINYLSKQPGRALTIIKDHSTTKQFSSFSSFLFKGNLFNTNYIIYDLAKIVPLDINAIFSSKTEFVIPVTRVEDGKTYYFSKADKDYFWEAQRGTMSLPYLCKSVKIGDYHYLDGGINQAFPYEYPLSHGYDKVVVISTREKSYRKKSKKFTLAGKIFYPKKKNFVKAVDDYAISYNKQIEYVLKCSENKTFFLICPNEAVNVSRAEKDKKKIEDLYYSGREIAKDKLSDLKEYLKNG